MIPKVIHYCWFGNKQKPDIVERCINSWRTYCPDYEICEWNESNYDISKYAYAKEAYSEKYWAFVSDVARLDIILNCGGIYLDTDVELKSGLDTYLENDAFYFFECDRRINTGMGFGACAGHFSVDKMLEYYKNRNFLKKGLPDKTPCPMINTDALRQCIDFALDGKTQYVQGIAVISGGEYAALGKHWSAGMWDTSTPVIQSTKRIYKDTALKRWLREPKKYDFDEKHLGKKVLWFYEFFSYDLMENGILYFVVRAKKKVCGIIKRRMK